MDDIPPPNVADEPAYEAKVLRAFIRGGRLVSLPARERKRRVILRFLIESVFPDLEPVQERDVNMRLALWNRDVSALRRYLVDAGLVTREAMVYRRAVPLREPAPPADRTGPPLV
jgi:hypothetical protein